MKKSNWHGGKGSSRRISNEQAYRDNWDKIFNKHKKEIAEYSELLRQNGVEPPNKKHYGDEDV
tara:strand:- start:436 stop:624 length:189 start_codon:yes stop_codon:yes gene_type:complete